MVVLSKNIFEIDPEEIRGTKVESTILGGRVVYRVC
jgi:predicted amidohydrolase YtcJ